MSEQVMELILNEVKQVNERIGRVEERIGQVEENIGKRIGRVEERIGRVEENVQSLHSGQTELFQLVTALKHGQELTHSKLVALASDFRQHEDRQTEMRSEIRFLNHRIADVEMDVEKLKNRPHL